MVNNGIRNEIIFVNYINGKKIFELNMLIQEMIYSEFENVNSMDIVYAKRTFIPEKTDFIIKINDVEKRVSLKIGNKNSVHTEPISEFIHFLIENGIPKDVVVKYLKFHYADGTTNGIGDKRVGVVEYKEKNLADFIKINEYFNDYAFLNKCIDRFILNGRNSTGIVDILVLGSVNDFIYLNRDEIISLINTIKVESTSIHVGPLFIQPLGRNLNYNSKYEKCRYIVQVKWYNLLDNFIEFKNKCLFDSIDNGSNKR